MDTTDVLEQDLNDESIGKYTPNSLKRASTPLSTDSSLHGTPQTPCSQVWIPFETDFKWNLCDREVLYSNEWDFSQQRVITSKMRSVLIDWMQEVASEFTLKRETYHNAVSYTDRYLTRVAVQKDEYQLLGLTWLYLSAKIEEINPPRLSDFSKSAYNAYTITQISNMERKVLTSLKWRLSPPTIYQWITWLLEQWDSFMIYNFPETYNDEILIVFKRSTKISYERYRELFQILDAAILDISVLRYSNKLLAGALLYLMVVKGFYQSDYKLLDFAATSSANMLDELSIFFGDGSTENQGFESVSWLLIEFLQKTIDIIELDEIYAVIPFFNEFLSLPITYELPTITKIQSQAKLESHYEEFLRYQTHNKQAIDFISKRNI